MNRQKKEIVKKIEYLNRSLEMADCYETPVEVYKELFKGLESAADELAKLRGFENVNEEWAYEMRVCPPAYLPYI
jgi:hypothetical protein